MKISYNSFITRNVGHGKFAFQLRVKRAERIKALITDCYNEYKKVNIIDVGGTKNYWDIIPKEVLIANNVHITIVNLPSGNSLPENDAIFTFREGDGCNLSEFEDNSFQIAHSNSVIEHVGDWNNVVNFSKEMKRVAKRYYLQTPNYWFPIEPHFLVPFIHWLPKPVRIWLVLHFNMGFIKKATSCNEAKETLEHLSLLSGKQLRGLFPDGTLYREKLVFFTKSLVVIRDNKRV
ncbi:hypothetical protein AGMMS49982_05890 [Bacteroidia bacterium]|nr:hypothetical protein AGMMS49982_05890 [Bacteroidia bacterium]